MNKSLSLIQIFEIARISLMIHIRQKIPFILVIFGVLVLVAARSVSTLGVDMQTRFFMDISLAMSTVLGTALCLMVSFEELIKEREKGTMQFVLAGPVSRAVFFAGKLSGVLLSNAAALIIMAAAAALSGWIGSMTLPSLFYLAIFFTWLRLSMLAVLVLFMSLLLSRALSVTISLFLFLYAHGSGFVLFAAERGGSDMLTTIIKWINLVIPDMTLLSLGGALIHGGQPSIGFVIGAAAYGMAVSLAFYLISVAVFKHQDL